jgi:signal transduction histidine kinase
VKLGGAQHFEVGLERVADELQLTIRDSVVGFDSSAVMDKRGLGLISVRERVNLVNGARSLTSVPEGGTKIQFRVPIAGKADVNHKSASA